MRKMDARFKVAGDNVAASGVLALGIRREGVAHAVYAHSIVFASRNQQDMHTNAPSLRNIAAKDCDSSAAKYLRKMRL